MKNDTGFPERQRQPDGWVHMSGQKYRARCNLNDNDSQHKRVGRGVVSGDGISETAHTLFDDGGGAGRLVSALRLFDDLNLHIFKCCMRRRHGLHGNQETFKKYFAEVLRAKHLWREFF